MPKIISYSFNVSGTPRFTTVMAAQIRFTRYDSLDAIDPSPQLLVQLKAFLDIASKHAVQLLVFPELSIPPAALPAIQEWSQNRDTVIVAGSHHLDGTPRYACCPIIFRGTIYPTYKATISPLEAASPYEEEHVVPGPHLSIFTNTPAGTIAVLICSDYLASENLAGILQHATPDIICIPSCDRLPDKHFYPKIDEVITTTPGAPFHLYCNLLCDRLGAGRSALFSLMRNDSRDLHIAKHLTDGVPGTKAIEIPRAGSYFIATLDLAHRVPTSRRSHSARANISIVDHDWKWDSTRNRHSRHPKRIRLVCFDLDGTLLRGETYSWTAIWRHLGLPEEQRTAWSKQYIEDSTACPDNRSNAYAAWCNRCRDLFRANGLTLESLKTIAQTLRPTRNLRTALLALRQEDIKLAVISGGIKEVMDYVLGEDVNLFDAVYINRFVFSSDGPLYAIEPTPFDFEGKRLAIAELCDRFVISPEECAFVGDSSLNDAFAFLDVGLALGYSEHETVFPEHVEEVMSLGA